MSLLSNFVSDISGFARKAAPLISAGAALSTGGQAASLMRAAAAANAFINHRLRNKVKQGNLLPYQLQKQLREKLPCQANFDR